MAKIKIQKNLSDADMFKGFTEEETFENAMLRGEGLRQAKIAKKRAVENKQDAFYREFLTEKNRDANRQDAVRDKNGVL